MGIQGLRKFISALSCTKTIYPREKKQSKTRSASAPPSINGSNATPKNSKDAAMESRVAAQVANIFNKQNGTADAADDDNAAAAASSSNNNNNTTNNANQQMNTGRLPTAHHVLFDLNSVIHSCFNRLEGSMCTAQNTIDGVKARIEEVLTTIVSPTRTLTICIDGPAPLAKIRTQRLRRRRVNTVNMAHSRQFSELSITAGSAFMVRLEREIALFLQSKYADLFGNPDPLPSNKGAKRVAVYLHGSTSAGEGESKISQMLAFHAYNPTTPYNPNDTVVIIGNDIDLTLTAMGCMYYHNSYVLSASSLQAFCIGDIIYRWLAPGAGFLQDAHYLPSARADLIFLFSLNGGDHFPGIGEAAADLWRRYKLLRSTSPSRMIVSEDLLSIDMAFLGDILQINEYEGQADPAVGLALLKASLWSTFTIITGCCPDYRFTVPDTMLPSVSNIKAALVANKHRSNACTIKYNPNAAPLTPLATYTAVMPTVEMFPDGALKTLNTLAPQTKVNVRTLVPFDGHSQQSSYFNGHNSNSTNGGDLSTQYRLVPVNLTLETIKKQLNNVNDTHMIVSGVEGLLKMAEDNKLLSPAEAARNTFTNPVYITAPCAERLKRMAELTKDIGRGRHLPEVVKKKKEDELKALTAQGPSFQIKQINIRKPNTAATGSEDSNTNTNNNSNNYRGGAHQHQQKEDPNVLSYPMAPLSIADNYYSTIREMLFTNIFNYSVNATFDDFEAAAELMSKQDKDGIDISKEEAAVAEEMNSFDAFLKGKTTAAAAASTASAGKTGAAAKAAASPLMTTSMGNNVVRRIPVVQHIPEHLQAIRDKAIKIQNKDQMQRDFTNMLKGKRDREVADDDDNTRHKEHRSEQQHNNNNNKKNAAAAKQSTRNRMEDDDDYDEDAMADLDHDDDEDDDAPRSSKKGGKKAAAAGGKKKKVGGGRSLADLSDDDDDGGYADAFADEDYDDVGGDLDDGFGAGSSGGKKKKGSAGGSKKKVGGKRK